MGWFCLACAVWLSADSQTLAHGGVSQFHQFTPLQKLMWVWQPLSQLCAPRFGRRKGRRGARLEAFCKNCFETPFPLLCGWTVLGLPWTKRWQSLISHLPQMAVWVPKGETCSPWWRCSAAMVKLTGMVQDLNGTTADTRLLWSCLVLVLLCKLSVI